MQANSRKNERLMNHLKWTLDLLSWQPETEENVQGSGQRAVYVFHGAPMTQLRTVSNPVLLSLLLL